MIDMTQYFYYEPPSRLQLVDKLEHLARYSDFLVVVTGVEGSGKTSVIKKLLNNTQGEGVKHIALSLTGETNDKQLAELCAKALAANENTESDPLTQLHEQSRSYQEVGQQLHMVIDNAEWLNDEAIELLSGLLMTGIGRPKIVLSGDQSIINRLHSLSINELLEGRLHIEELHPFEFDECKEFLKLAFSSQRPLKKKVVKELYESSGGHPGKLTAAASALYRSGKVAEKGKTALPLPPVHIAGISSVLLAVLGVSIWQFYPDDVETDQQVVDSRVSVPLVVSVPEQQKIEEQIEEVKSSRSELSRRLEEQERLLAEELKNAEKDTEAIVTQKASQAIQSSEETTVEKPLSVEKTIVAVLPVAEEKPVVIPPKVEKSVEEAEEPVIEKVVEPAVVKAVETVAEKTVDVSQPVVKPQVDQEVDTEKQEPVSPSVKQTVTKTPIGDQSKTNKVLPKVVEAKTETKPVSAVKPAPEKLENKVAAKAVSPWLKEEELLTWPSNGYTLQVLGARSGESVEKFMASKASRDKLYYFTTTFKNKPWHVVVYGQYANRNAAKRAIESLPAELKNLKPWPRSIAGVQQDIGKK